MQDKKYGTIQFTVNDLAKIRAAQAALEDELGVKISLAQTVMYGIDKISRMAAINRRVAHYEAMEANMKAAQEAQAYYAANPDRKPPTVKEILQLAEQDDTSPSRPKTPRYKPSVGAGRDVPFMPPQLETDDEQKADD